MTIRRFRGFQLLSHPAVEMCIDAGLTVAALVPIDIAFPQQLATGGLHEIYRSEQ
ncbi:MAG: hypothetical protein KFH87_09190 [Bacteroidetes bacterium]|nr:hypothetical protein [Bacteroidota bacterium]